MSEINSASFPLFTAHGVRVHFTVPFDGDGQAVNAVVERLLANGYSVNVAGAAPGETVEEVGFVSRREKADGTPVLDLFSPNEMLAHRVFAHYLDTPEMIADFENATGLKLDEIPVWIAEQPIKKTSNTWRQYGVQTRRVARIALKDNPKHDPAETDVSKKKPKHLFSQWLPSAQPTEPQRYPAILDKNNKPTGTQNPPPAATEPPTQAASLPSTAPTGTASGASREPKIIDGSDPDVLDGVFGKRDEVFTPNALWSIVAPLFNARKHFDNWLEKHAAEMADMTLDEAKQFAQDHRWNHIAARVNDLKAMALNLYGMSGKEVNEALTIANEKTIVKWTDWQAGDWHTAQGALLAWQAGYVANNALDIAHEKSEITQAVLAEAELICESYQSRETA